MCLCCAGLPLVPLMDGSLHMLQAMPAATSVAYVGDALDRRLLGMLPGTLVDCELLGRETADRWRH